MVRSNRLKLLLIFIAQLVNKRYYSVKIDPIFACNLKCRMCYFSQSRKSESACFTIEEIDIIAKNTFRNALQVVVGCGAEPTMYKDFVYIIRKAKETGVPNVSLVTNAQLIKQNHLVEMLDSGLDELIISIHGTTKETYERFMVGAKWEKLIEVLDGFNLARANKLNCKTSLRINYTANPDNYSELLSFFDVFTKYNVSTLQVRPVMAIGGEYESGFKQDDIVQYQNVILKLKEQCDQHNLQLLANVENPTYSDSGKVNPIVAETYKYISPNSVIDNDFDWRNEPYRKFQKGSRWRTKILRKVFFLNKQKHTDDLAERYSGRYDVF